MKKTVLKVSLLIIFACICSILIYYNTKSINKNNDKKRLFEISYTEKKSAK